MNTQNSPSGMVRAVSPVGTHEFYMPGFGNDFETEALPGALPQGMNSPQKCNYGLYGEQLSGTAFTAPSHQNERTWCYRIRPSVKHTHRFKKIAVPHWKSAPLIDPEIVSLGQYRWDPVAVPDQDLNWITGMRQMLSSRRSRATSSARPATGRAPATSPSSRPTRAPWKPTPSRHRAPPTRRKRRRWTSPPKRAARWTCSRPW